MRGTWNRTAWLVAGLALLFFAACAPAAKEAAAPAEEPAAEEAVPAAADEAPVEAGEEAGYEVVEGSGGFEYGETETANGGTEGYEEYAESGETAGETEGEAAEPTVPIAAPPAPVPPVSSAPESTSGPAPTAAPSRPEEPYEIVRIFYGTDRASTGDTRPNDFYGGERSREGLLYGTCEVSIPRRTHRVGEVERPKWWKLEFREDPEKHVVLARVLPQTRDRFFTLLQNRVGESARREAFVFVHGFNVSFAEAAWRTGQITYDLKFDGAPILYSWPSQGGALEYTIDETNVRWTESHLQQFLEEIVAQSGAERLYLVAHSMGNRALTEVLKDLAVRIRAGEMPAFTEIFLTAPDIDADTFRDEIAPKITAAAHRVTLYASDKDKALKASKEVNGYPRAGDAGEGLVVVEGIDTVDATEVATDFLGHSYFDSVVLDIDQLVRYSLPPQERGLLEAVRGGLRYWVMRPREE